MTAANLVTRWSSWAPYLRSILRIVAAFSLHDRSRVQLPKPTSNSPYTHR